MKLSQKWIKEVLKEDIGNGDITTDALFENYSVRGKMKLFAKDKGIFCGGVFIPQIIRVLGEKKAEYIFYKNEGEEFKKNEILVEINGSIRNLLTGERVILNIIQRLSGIATLTRKFVQAVKGTNIKILDTRKTTPGMRFLEKYAVRVGGGCNHRMDLSSGILIKDNHILGFGSIKEAIKKIKEKVKNLPIEIEVQSLKSAKEAIQAGADILLLDNMPRKEIMKIISFAKKRVLLEVSGGITLKNIKNFKDLPIDFISIGALTHSFKIIDISAEIERI